MPQRRYDETGWQLCSTLEKIHEVIEELRTEVNMYFTTREYETFTLPAGMYDAVRITIGDAEGKNWWCVLYPPLCLPAAQSEETLEQALDEQETDLVTRNPQYEVRFAVVEWFENLKQMFSW